jgi:hypothetical protein
MNVRRTFGDRSRPFVAFNRFLAGDASRFGQRHFPDPRKSPNRIGGGDVFDVERHLTRLIEGTQIYEQFSHLWSAAMSPALPPSRLCASPTGAFGRARLARPPGANPALPLAHGRRPAHIAECPLLSAHLSAVPSTRPIWLKLLNIKAYWPQGLGPRGAVLPNLLFLPLLPADSVGASASGPRPTPPSAARASSARATVSPRRRFASRRG